MSEPAKKRNKNLDFLTSIWQLHILQKPPAPSLSHASINSLTLTEVLCKIKVEMPRGQVIYPKQAAAK